MTKLIGIYWLTTLAILATAAPAAAQTCNQPAPGTEGNGSAPVSATVGTRATFIAPPPADYIIGADDVLAIDFWRDDSMSREVVVRPDGKISLPLLNDIQAAGLTPAALCLAVTDAAQKFLETPNVSVTVKQINSRKVYITGMVGKPGPYNMTGPITVLQLIALAGGLQEFADRKNIIVMRTEAGKDLFYKVNYEDLSRGRRLGQNIELRPGDTVIVR